METVYIARIRKNSFFFNQLSYEKHAARSDLLHQLNLKMVELKSRGATLFTTEHEF